MKRKKAAVVLLAGVLAGTTLLSGCEMDPDAVVLTVDGTEVSLGFANFVTKYNQAELDYYYVYYFGEDVWTQDSSSEEGKTMGDVQKESVLEQLETWYVLENAKDDYGVSVSDEEQEEITAAAEEFMEANDEDAIEAIGATQEYAEKMLYFYLLEDKMEEAISEEAEITVTEEDAACRAITYISFTDPDEYEEDSEDEDSEDEDSEDEDSEDEESALFTLEDIEAYAESAQEDFDTVCDEVEEIDADYEQSYVSEYSYAADDEYMDEELMDAADALSEEGDVSELIEGDGYYYIVRLDSEYDEEASEEYYEELVLEEQNEYYTEVLEEMEDDADISLKRLQWRKVEMRDTFDIVSDDDEDSDDESEDTDETDESDESEDTEESDEEEDSEDTEDTEEEESEETEE